MEKIGIRTDAKIRFLERSVKSFFLFAHAPNAIFQPPKKMDTGASNNQYLIYLLFNQSERKGKNAKTSSPEITAIHNPNIIHIDKAITASLSSCAVIITL